MNFFEEAREKYGTGVVLITTLFIMICILALTIKLHDKSIKSFKVDDHKFTLDSYAFNRYIFVDDVEDEMIVEVTREFGSLFRDLKIIYDNTTYETVSDEDIFHREIYINGELKSTLNRTSVVVGNESESEIAFEEELIHAIEKVISYLVSNTLNALIAYKVFLMVLGVVIIIVPEFFWYLKYSIVVKDGEPSELSLVMYRILGVVLCGFSLFYYI